MGISLKITLPLLSLGLFGLFFVYNNQNYSKLKLAENLLNSYNSQTLPNDIKTLEELELKQEEAIKELSTIPNYPLSPYTSAQINREKLELMLKQINKKKEDLINLEKSKQYFDEAQKLALEAINLSKNPPHSVEIWQKTADKWLEAIDKLNMISLNSDLSLTGKEKRATYEGNLRVANQKLEAEINAKRFFISAQKIATEAVNFNKINSLENKEESMKKWKDAIAQLKQISSGTTLSENANKKIREYLNIIKQIEEDINKIKQIELKRQKEAQIAEQKSIAQRQKQEAERKNINKANRLVEDYLREVTTTSKEGYSYWCASSYSVMSALFSPRDYEILDITISGNIASYGVRIASSNRGGQPVINNWTIYLEKEDNNWCIALISEAQ